MTGHDQLVDQVAGILLKDLRGNYVSQNVAWMYEKADAVLATVEPVIRADERERIAAALTALGYDYPAEVARNGGSDV